jgi:thiol-disulfide isomerase/thioredoxin
MGKLSIVVAILALAAFLAVTGCDQGTSQDSEQVPITFIEFYDPQCPFCAEMEPIVEDLEGEYAERFDEWQIIDITTDEGKEQVEEYGVFLTPTFVLLDENGDELDRVTGATTEENMIAFIDRAIADVTGEDTGPRPDIEGEGSTIGDDSGE